MCVRVCLCLFLCLRVTLYAHTPLNVCMCMNIYRNKPSNLMTPRRFPGVCMCVCMWGGGYVGVCACVYVVVFVFARDYIRAYAV